MLRALVATAFAMAALAAPALAAGPAPAPKTGAAPWPAPKDPMRLAKLAGLVPDHFEHLTYHVHSHLDIYVNGRHETVPAGIGIAVNNPGVEKGKLPDGSIAYGGIKNCATACISSLHTHADLGLLHTENAKPVPNRLGQFFVEWGVRLDRSCVGGYCKPDSIAFYVNGRRYAGDPRRILLADHAEIAIVIGTPPKKVPARFPNVPV